MKDTKQIFIESNNHELYKYLESDLPTGVTLEPKLPIISQRDITIPTTIEFIVNINVAEVIKNVGLLYLLSRIKRTRGKTNLTVNGKQIPIDKPNAIDLITKEINGEKDQED